MRQDSRRAGFTLTELLIVIGILLLMATLAVAVYSNNKNTDRLRSAARVAQSAFLGAKDRAMHAKQPRGVRLTRDANGPQFANGIPCLVNGSIFVQPIEHDPYPAGSIEILRPDFDGNGGPDSPDPIIVHGLTVDWPQASNFFASPGQIRIPAGRGQWYQFTPLTAAPYAGGYYLQLAVPYIGTSPIAMPSVPAFLSTDTTSNSCEIQFGNEVLPFHQPIPMPSGTTIDLRYSSANVQFLAGSSLANASFIPVIDISFSPRGNITGATGGMGSLMFVLRDLNDAMLGIDPSSPQVQGDCLVVSVNSQTGLVATYNADLSDNYINTNGPNTGNPAAPGSDGLVDNIFSYAQQGKAAGR